MTHTDPSIHPLYTRTLSRDVSPEIQTQLKRYCDKFEYDISTTYYGPITGAQTQYKVRLYGLRGSCRLLVDVLVAQYV